MPGAGIGDGGEAPLELPTKLTVVLLALGRIDAILPHSDCPPKVIHYLRRREGRELKNRALRPDERHWAWRFACSWLVQERRLEGWKHRNGGGG